jgi:hypothetical protein
MEYEPVDYETSPMTAIRISEISRLDGLLFTIEKLSKLCDRDAERVAVEFGFKGTLEDVRDQLVATIDRYALKGIGVVERLTLRRNEKRINKWHTTIRQEDATYKDKIKNALAKQDMTGLGEVAQHFTEHGHTLHSKKECICFTNPYSGGYWNVSNNS